MEDSNKGICDPILQEANADSIPIMDNADMIQDHQSLYNSEEVSCKSNKILSEKNVEKISSNGEGNLVQDALSVHHEPENNENKGCATLKLKLEKLPKHTHGKLKEFWQKKAVTKNEVSVNSKPNKEDKWNEIRKKNVLARTWARFNSPPKTSSLKHELSEESHKAVNPLPYKNEVQKNLFSWIDFSGLPHVDEVKRLNTGTSAVLPLEFESISNENSGISVADDGNVQTKNEILKSKPQLSIQNEDLNVAPQVHAVSGYCPFSTSSTAKTPVFTANETVNDVVMGNVYETSPTENNYIGKSNVTKTTNNIEPSFLKPANQNLPPNYSINNSKMGLKSKPQKSDSNGKLYAENQNSVFVSSGCATENNKLSDSLLHQRPSVIIHTEQIRSPPPALTTDSSKGSNISVENGVISHQTLSLQNQCNEQFFGSLKLQPPHSENKVFTKQFYDPITKQLHDLPVSEPTALKSRITSNTHSAKKRSSNSKKSSDTGHGRNDQCDKVRSTLWKTSNGSRKNPSPYPTSSKVVKRKKVVASSQNSGTKVIPVLSVPLVEQKKIKHCMPVIHSSPFISSLSRSANSSFKLSPYVHRNPKSSGSNEPLDLSMKLIVKVKSKRPPTMSGVPGMMGLDLSLKKCSPSPHASSISCGIENITPPPITSLRDPTTMSDGMDYLPSSLRKKFQTALLESRTLSSSQNKGPQSNTPVSQLPSTSLTFISRSHPLYSVSASSNSSRHTVHLPDTDSRLKPNAYMSPLWLPPPYEAKTSMPQLAPHGETKQFFSNQALSPQLYPYINNDRQCCNDQRYFAPHSK